MGAGGRGEHGRCGPVGLVAPIICTVDHHGWSVLNPINERTGTIRSPCPIRIPKDHIVDGGTISFACTSREGFNH